MVHRFHRLRAYPFLSAGESKDEEYNEFIRWVHRTRRLSSMYALRASVSVADVRLERKLRYDYAKLTARGQLRNRTRYASATTVAAGAGQAVTNNPPIDTTSGEKRPRSQDDPGHDAQKHPRRMGSLAEGESQIPMSSPTLVPSPLYQVLVLAMATKSFQGSLHVELAVPFLIEQRLWGSVCTKGGA